MLETVDFSLEPLPKEEYKVRRDKLMEQLVVLQQQARQQGVGLVVLFEGWNGAGKGSRISDLMFNLDARATSVAVTEDLDIEAARTFAGAPYGVTGFYPVMQKFWEELGPRGNITFYDRGWYTAATQHMLYTEFGDLSLDEVREKHKGDGRAYIGEKSRRMQQRRKNLERRQQQEIQEKETLLKDVEKVDDLTVKPLRHHKKYLVEAENLEIFYGGKKVCGPLNIQLEQGQRLALGGRNGSGKSSILKMILGSDISYRGDLRMPSDLKISYVPQDTSGLHGSLESFIRERKLDKTLFLTILRKMDVSRDLFEKPMESYSSGQKKKVLLAGSLSESAHLYIWDEPLNYMDIFSRMQIEAFIQKVQPTMLIVEHDRRFVENIANSVISMEAEY